MQAFQATKTAVVTGICFAPDGRALVTTSSEGAVAWDVTGTPQVLRRFPSQGRPGGPVCVSPCGRFLTVWKQEGYSDRILVFDLTNPIGEVLTVLEASWAETMSFAPDGTEFAAPFPDPFRWSVPSWAAIPRAPSPVPRSHPRGSPQARGGVTYTPDGRALVVGVTVPNDVGPRFYDSHFWLIDRRTGVRTADHRTTFGHAAPTHVAVSPDGAVLVGNFGPVLGVVTAADGTEVARIKSGTKNITSIGFVPNGSKLVTVSNDKKVRVFETRTWTETAGYEWKIGRLWCLAVAPDGLRMAAGSDRGKVIVWDMDE